MYLPSFLPSLPQYSVAFGLRVRELGYAMTWGTVCEQREEEGDGALGVGLGAHQGPAAAGAGAAAGEAISSTTANTLCRQVKAGICVLPLSMPYSAAR